ncbi:MAG: dnaG [Parcubacteria group bacterium]|nr:dnaG [Parcubacteria group bacterium]
MRGTVDTIKERLDIVEVVSAYVKLEKAGQNYKGRCPFHSEKTASFFVSPERQNYYCFGCGAKGDIFTIVSALDGLDFKDALRLLAERAGVEVTNEKGESKDEKDKLYSTLEEACSFFQGELKKYPEIEKYLKERGIEDSTIQDFRIGVAPDEWRATSAYLQSVGHSKETLLRVGLIKQPEKTETNTEATPYDVFRGRIMFPIFDPSGRVIAFSGRAIDPDAPAKYLNSPETVLFRKSEILYGLDKAKDDIRKKNYAVLVEGQIDLVLSHQAGVKNTVASSGTAFTQDHFERLKRLSSRIILAFDGDTAGKKAAEKSALIGLSLGMEVKIAELPEGKDPADLVKKDIESWKEVLRTSVHAIEYALRNILATEKDARKSGKLVFQQVLPLVVLLHSAIERSHFVSLISRLTGIREEVIWDDLKQIKVPQIAEKTLEETYGIVEDKEKLSRKDTIKKRLEELVLWKKEVPDTSSDSERMLGEEKELERHYLILDLEEKRKELQMRAGQGEDVFLEIEKINKELDIHKRKSF